MSETELRRMMDRASIFAEAAMDDVGEVAPIWHMVTRDGTDLIGLSPPGLDKDGVIFAVRAAMETQDVIRYVHLTEAWTLEGPIPDNDLDKVRNISVSTHPDRIEIVMIVGEDHECGQLMGHRRIIRDGKPHLGPLEIHDWDQSEGRMVGLLPVKGKVQ